MYSSNSHPQTRNYQGAHLADPPVLNEKLAPPPPPQSQAVSIPLSYPCSSSSQERTHIPAQTHSFPPCPASRYTRPRSLRIWNLFKSWLPFLLYGATSLGFVLAIAFWKTEVFDGLDDLAHWLRKDEPFGYAVLFCLIFITTFPPLPLYSTLITLSGYTFGAIPGFFISYTAALSGALVVFLLSRCISALHTPITHFLSASPRLARAVRAISRRPQLLFLVRLAPYPYNVLNMLLAAAPGLTIGRYVSCTALSLFKIGIHTSIGAGIRSFGAAGKKSDAADGNGNGEGEDDWWSKAWTVFGILLCIAILVYLSVVARRAVDDELGDESGVGSVGLGRSEMMNAEEGVALMDPEGDGDVEGQGETLFDADIEAGPSARSVRDTSTPMTEAQLVPQGLVSV